MKTASFFGSARSHIYPAALLVLGSISVTVSGCAGLGSTNQNVKRNTASDAGPSREERKEAVAREFDQQRDEAQLEAAASCWQRGDVEGCTRILGKLLERDPNNHRAGLLLADVELFNGQTEQAATQLQTLVAAEPKDAAAQHALAQVWDANGRHQEALAHYELATQLDPKNEEYALSYKMAAGIATLPAGSATSTAGSTDSHSHDDTSVPTQQLAYAPPAKINDWLGRLDFGNGSYATATNSADGASPSSLANPNSALAGTAHGSPTSPQQLPTVTAAPVSQSSPVVTAAPIPMPPKPTGAGSEVVLASAVSPIAPTVQSASLAEPAGDSQKSQDPLHLAAAALARGDTEAAIDIASRGLSETPDQAAALYRLLGTAHYRRAEYQAAQAAFTQALSLDKSDALSYFLMGSTLDKLQQHEAAQGYFSQAASLDARYAF